MANVICIANQKGGTGKTTSAVNLASYFARHGRRTLILDMEPQANVTLSLGLDPRFFDKTIYQVLLNECSLKEVIKKDILEILDYYISQCKIIIMHGAPYDMMCLKKEGIEI